MAANSAKMPKADTLRAAQVCDLFLDFSERHNERLTFFWYRHFLQRFLKAYGRVLAADLKPTHVTRWLDATNWDGSRRNAVIALKRAFNCADKQDLLSRNPLRNVEKPASRRRTRLVTPAERDEILVAVPDRNFCEFLAAPMAPVAARRRWPASPPRT